MSYGGVAGEKGDSGGYVLAWPPGSWREAGVGGQSVSWEDADEFEGVCGLFPLSCTLLAGPTISNIAGAPSSNSGTGVQFGTRVGSDVDGSRGRYGGVTGAVMGNVVPIVVGEEKYGD